MPIQVRYTLDALAAARRHAHSSSQEIYGVCFGRIWQTHDGDWLICVDECWPMPHAQSTRASVTATHQSWAAALVRLDLLRAQMPDHDWRIVGWYHSHPGFGIFLSGVDQAAHRTYFTQPWHVALVIDPYSDAEGWFGRNAAGEIVRLPTDAIAELSNEASSE
jgi:proteasome lid subunit RPN8/RPN11